MLFVQLLVIIVKSVTATTDVEIHTVSPVYANKPVDLVILPCNYTVSDPNAPVSIHWERDQEADWSVLWRYSNGVVDPGPAYKYIADLGEGCSLILKNPSDDLAGRYTVSINVDPELSSNVQLFIVTKPTKRPYNVMDTIPPGDTPTAPTTTSSLIIALMVVLGCGLVSIFVVLGGILRVLRRAKWLGIPQVEAHTAGGHHTREPNREVGTDDSTQTMI